MSDRVSTSELRETWESAAPGWAKWETEFAKNLVRDGKLGKLHVPIACPRPIHIN